MRKWVVCTIVCTAVLAGCGIGGSKTSTEQIDPPKEVTYKDQEGASTKTEPTAKQGEKNEAVNRELYLVDKNGYVVPQTLAIPTPQDNAVIKQALQYLVKEGPVTGMLPNGFEAVLPADTEVNGVDVKDGVAIADFSEEFKNYKKDEERRIVEAVTWTLTQFKEVKQVKFRINGKDLTAMPVNKTPIGNGISRADGINFDDEQVADITNTKPVTLYFLAQTNKQTYYYVPVTRRIANSEKNELAAVVKELVKGPSPQSMLSSDLNHDVKLLGEPKYENGKVTLNFNENIYGSPDKNIISTYVLNSLVLSLTEQEGINSVSIEVNGKPDIVDEQGQKLTKPVTRPQNVNTGSF